MENQAFIFFIFVLDGLLIGLLFDLFRISRRTFKTGDIITNIEDVFFWLIAGFIILYSIFKFNNGQIRSYIFLGTILGVLLYILIFSKTFMKISLAIINTLKKISNILIIKPIKILSKPIILLFKKVKQLKKLYNKKKKEPIKKDFV